MNQRNTNSFVRISEWTTCDSDNNPVNKRLAIPQIGYVLLLGLLWGLNWPAIKFMLTELPPLTIRAIAFPSAALLLAAVVRITGQRLLPASRDWIPLVVTGGFIIFGFNVLSTFGQMFTEASTAAIIAYTMPVITSVLAVIFLREKLTRRSIIALAIGMFGLVVLASEDFTALINDPRGIVVMLVAALSWSIGNVTLKARDWSLPPLALTVWFFVVSAVACAPLMLVFEPPWQQTWPSFSVILALGFHIVGPMVICYTIWTVMVDKLPTTIAALSTLTAPVVGVVSAILLMEETLSWQKILSLLMIVLSVALTVNTTNK